MLLRNNTGSEAEGEIDSGNVGENECPLTSTPPSRE